jgi:hypothetical protein
MRRAVALQPQAPVVAAPAQRAARWSESGGWQLIEGDGEAFAAIQARGISADGDAVVGAAQFFGTILQEGFQSQLRPLSFPPLFAGCK